MDPDYGVVGAYDDLANVVLDQNSLIRWIELDLNGSRDFKEQEITVRYLRNDQRLILPKALGMTLAGDGFAKNNSILQDRYKRTTTMTYATIRNFIVPVINRDAIDKAMITNDDPVPEVNALRQDWKTDTWFTYGNDEIEEPTKGHAVMSIFSLCLQFNCDIRDYGMLNTNDMTLADGAWMNVDDVPVTRLNCKLMPHTLQNIAALNYPCTHTCALAAWVRAYGTSMGLLPNAASACMKEYVFTTAHPTDEHKNKVIEYGNQFEGSLITLCANILAMFGLLNLHNDQIYETNLFEPNICEPNLYETKYERRDSNIIYLGKSYIETLRTSTNANVVKYMINNMEAVVRTGPHPFGLAQTYFLAKVMFVHKKLTLPLGTKINTTPPPVKRVMICDSIPRQWDCLPSGQLVSEHFRDELNLIRNAVTTIKASPPEYSYLATLYGVDAQKNVNDDVMDAVGRMMPCVSGYISADVEKGGTVRHGLGFALNLRNIGREAWAHFWEKYTIFMDDVGVEELIADLRIAKLGQTGVH